MVISIVIGALKTISKGLVKRVQDLEIRIQTEPARLQHYWDRPEDWKNPRDLMSLAATETSEKPSANAGVKNSQMSVIMIKMIRSIL